MAMRDLQHHQVLLVAYAMYKHSKVSGCTRIATVALQLCIIEIPYPEHHQHLMTCPARAYFWF